MRKNQYTPYEPTQDEILRLTAEFREINMRKKLEITKQPTKRNGEGSVQELNSVCFGRSGIRFWC